MNLSGKWKIRTKVNEITGRVSYRTVLVSKDIEGNSEFYSIFLNLVGEAKNKPIDDNTFIVVKPENAWLSFYKKGENDSQVVAVVKDFEYSDEPEPQFKEPADDDDLPF